MKQNENQSNYDYQLTEVDTGSALLQEQSDRQEIRFIGKSM